MLCEICVKKELPLVWICHPDVVNISICNALHRITNPYTRNSRILAPFYYASVTLRDAERQIQLSRMKTLLICVFCEICVKKFQKKSRPISYHTASDIMYDVVRLAQSLPEQKLEQFYGC